MVFVSAKRLSIVQTQTPTICWLIYPTGIVLWCLLAINYDLPLGCGIIYSLGVCNDMKLYGFLQKMNFPGRLNLWISRFAAYQFVWLNQEVMTSYFPEKVRKHLMSQSGSALFMCTVWGLLFWFPLLHAYLSSFHYFYYVETILFTQVYTFFLLKYLLAVCFVKLSLRDITFYLRN